MNRVKIILLILTLLALPEASIQALDSSRHLSDYVIEAWKTEQGLPSVTVNTIIQAKDGYLWVGTQGGLARFDGVRFETFTVKNSPELGSNWINIIYEDSLGLLWIGSKGGGLTKYKDGKFMNFSKSKGLPGNIVTDICEDESNNLWVATDGGGIARFDRKSLFTVYTAKDGLLSNKAMALHKARGGGIWIGTFKGLNKFKTGSFIQFTKKDGLSHEMINSLYETENKELWIGTDGGLNFLKNGKFTVYTTDDGLPHNTIYDIRGDKHGLLWIGTDEGLCRRENGNFSSLAVKDGLTYDRIFCVSEDHEGSLWVGTHGGGLNRLREDKFITYSTKNGIPEGLIWAITEDKDGILWIGTDSGGLIRKEGRKFTQIDTRHGLSGNCANSLFADKDGTIWIGTRSGGLNRFRNGKFKVFTTADGLSYNRIRAVFRDSRGNLWVGTSNGLNLYKNGKFTIFTTADGLSQNSIRYIYEDSKRTLWFATDEGITFYKDGKFSSITGKDVLPDSRIYCFFEDSDGAFWVGTGAGLSRLENGIITSYSSTDGLFDSVACMILEDDNNNLWISGHKGIYRISKKDIADYDKGSISTIPMLRLEPLCNGGIQPAGWRDSKGKMWFPAVRGLVMVDPEYIKINKIPPKIVIEKIAADEEMIRLDTVDRDTQIRFSPGKKRFEFFFTGLSFLQPDYVNFKYQLEGFDDDFVDIGTKRNASFTNLKPGNYSFHVIASNNDGVWSEEAATVDFYVEPYFYQAWWFYVILLVFGSIAVVAIYRIRVYNLHKQQKILKNLVDIKTKELKKSNKKLEDTNKQLDQKVRKRTRKLEETNRHLIHAAQVKTEFMANVSHELRTPLASILGYTEILRREDMTFEKKKIDRFLDIINDQGDHLLRLVSSMLDVNSLESGAVVLKLTQHNINDLINESIKQLQHKLSDFKGKLRLSLDDKLKKIYVDHDKVIQIFSSILDNAIKFSLGDQDITITTGKREEKVFISISDKGVGIPENQINLIFSPFYQVDSSATRKFSGTGLGLYVAKRYVELHDGEISVSSKEGEGTTFEISLSTDLKPAQKPKETEKKRREKGKDESYKTVLVVDDNDDVGEIVRFMLKDDYIVHTANNGEEGVSKSQELKPSLIFMDLAMPGISGFEATKRIKSNKETTNIPVVALSARTMPEEIERAIQSGCSEHIPKPFSIKAINDVVARYCS